MRKIIDNELDKIPQNPRINFFQMLVNVYAVVLSIFFIALLSNLNIKTEPSPLETTDVLEIQASYSMLAGLCINVGDCGNDQVVLGLEKNTISSQLYQFLIWKKPSTSEE